MAPIGWKHISVPTKAPMRETNESKAGMELAMIYPIAVTPKVQDNQTIQCVGVLLFRWREPRRILTKMYFAGILKREKKVREVEMKKVGWRSYMCDDCCGDN